MKQHVDLSFGNSVLPCQYNDVVRRRTELDGEHRLLCAVLEDTTRTYLSNVKCLTRDQRLAFEEVRTESASRSLFTFRRICGLLGIEATSLIRSLKSPRAGDLPTRRQHGVGREQKLSNSAA